MESIDMGGDVVPGRETISPSSGVSRRRFTQAIGLGALEAVLPWSQMRAVAAEAGVSVDKWMLVPEDKQIPQQWLDELTVRGSGSVLRGNQLDWMGMPIGGLTCGQVYLSGDGRLWHWDVDNRISAHNDNGIHFRQPLTPASPFECGTVLRTKGGGESASTRFLDGRGFSSVSFHGRYPVGVVDLTDPGSPLTAKLTAYSPFSPLDVDGSSRPLTVMEYALTNRSSSSVEAEIGVFSENPVCLDTRSNRRVELVATTVTGAAGTPAVEFTVVDPPPAVPEHPDRVLADWEDGTYQGWVSVGDAFGAAPIAVADLPPYVTGVNATGAFLAFSHNTRLLSDTDYEGRDALTGTLTSPEFVIDRLGLRAWIGGGNMAGKTCLNVKVDGQVVASVTGTGNNTMTERKVDLSAFRGATAVIELVDNAGGSYAYLNVDSIILTDQVDVVFEDFEKPTYEGWTVEGTAFGAGPVLVSSIPSYQGNVNAVGSRCVNSHASAPGSSIAAKDGATGRLTSREFTITHDFMTFRIGGGNHPGVTGLQVEIGGEVVAEATGANSNTMADTALGLFRWRGQKARIVILDQATSDWGNVGIDQIVFTDNVGPTTPIELVPDAGSFSIAVDKAGGWATTTRAAIADWSTPAAVFDSPAAAGTAETGQSQAGAITAKAQIGAGETKTIRFYYAWYFPVTRSLDFLRGTTPHRRHYSTIYTSAADVVRRTHSGIGQSAASTALWRKTFYDDSSLPWWFLERTFAPVATLATSTVYRLADGRFYGWEGAYCCAGTCTHVWHYAQAVGRLFPSLEKDTRERVDLAIGFHADTGEIGMRAEADMGWAADGQAGSILRVYREHQMSSDDTWLTTQWPKVRKALQWMIVHDNPQDGLLDGGQPNTLDATWYGHVAWLSGLYIAALRAGQVMAIEMGDAAFAATCSNLASQGSSLLDTELYNGQWYVQKPDPAHLDSVRITNGVHIDQVMGQSWAFQLGLPRVSDREKTINALNNLWRYNFTPAPIDYREHSPVNGGRTYYDADSHALLMCTWPAGGEEYVGGDWTVGYFNEAMNGFEYQVAGHMIHEGLVDKGLLITRSIHDRYRADRRNPYNEVECGDHYSRSMASFGVYLALLGFEHHGPSKHLGFAPRIQRADFKAAFVTCSGWGLYRQEEDPGGTGHRSFLDVRQGTLELKTLRLDAGDTGQRELKVRLSSSAGAKTSTVPATATRESSGRLLITFPKPLTIAAGGSLDVRV